jgi:hypothetical protein
VERVSERVCLFVLCYIYIMCVEWNVRWLYPPFHRVFM